MCTARMPFVIDMLPHLTVTTLLSFNLFSTGYILDTQSSVSTYQYYPHLVEDHEHKDAMSERKAVQE